MIALIRRRGKASARIDPFCSGRAICTCACCRVAQTECRRSTHAYVNSRTMTPNFRQGRVKLFCNKNHVASGSGPNSKYRIPRPPAPRACGIGPESSVTCLLSLRTQKGRQRWPFCLSDGERKLSRPVAEPESALAPRGAMDPLSCHAGTGSAFRAMSANGTLTRELYCSAVMAAPSIAPGRAAVPVCTNTATPSTPSVFTSLIGTLQLAGAPFHSPTLIQRRTVL